MKRKSLFMSFVLLFAMTLVFNGCDLDPTNVETKPAESALDVLKTFSDVILTVDNGLVDDTATAGKRLLGDSYTETTTGEYPNKVKTWDFGTTGDYQGVIIIQLTDDYKNPLAVANVTFQDFTYKGKPVDGMLTFENLGKNSEEQEEFNLELNNTRVGDNHLEAGWMLQRTEGGETPDQSDDIFTIFQIQEKATGMTDEGVAFTLDVQEALILDLACEFILTKGVFEMLFDNSMLRADFGNGDCDNKVRVSDGKISADIYIK